MLKGDGNENGIKIKRSNQQKKKIGTCSTLFFLIILLAKKKICTFLPFFVVVLHDYNAILYD